ncbi:hypothetical protein M9H77_30163 [Catharanthus roseus]|uniref:Uncharacterized protein n=1 Tax=Catharanthus roseus TaxID=4058 RepID=A0ACB9ZWU7_CATRO|nr:hypothetical protein M9H77_30163 [Catharanthus roseus]
MGENYEERGSIRGGRTRKGKGKKVASEVRLPERFISLKEAANFEEWTKKRRKIAPGHKVDLSDMEGTVQKQENITYQWVTSGIFQYFVLNLVRIGDHIGLEKIYNKHIFKRMGSSRNEEGMLVRGGQEDDDKEEDEEEDEGQDAMKVDKEVSEEEPEEETFRRKMKQKKRQERVKEGQSSGMHKRSLKDDLRRSKRPLKITRLYEDKVIKLKTLKTRRMLLHQEYIL